MYAINEIVQDAYLRSYNGNEEGNFGALKRDQKALEAGSEWIPIGEFSVLPMEDESRIVEYQTAHGNHIPYEVLRDTANNAGLMLSYNGTAMCLRDCAMPSLLNTIGINGDAIRRASKEVLANGLSIFARCARKESKLLLRGGKVCAVLSPHYQTMPISELLEACSKLEKTFGLLCFRGGSIAHDMTVAEFEFPEKANTFSKVYAAAKGSYVGDIIPIVQFQSSDTSGAAATLRTFLKLNGIKVPLGGFRVTHTQKWEGKQRTTSMSAFVKELDGVFAKMSYDINKLLPKMLETEINNPGNTFIGLCRYAGIPQKWGGAIEENIRAQWDGYAGCTMLDLYEAMAECIYGALKEGYQPYSPRVLALEEGIAKVANNPGKWKEFDLPGTVSWSARK